MTIHFRWNPVAAFAVTLSLLACHTLCAQQKLEPGSPAAKAHTLYEATSSGELRYTWVLPKDYPSAPKRKFALTVLLHGTGLDYRWGHANHPIGKFRPNDVVVSVDGTSPGQGETRLFLGKPEDAKRFNAFLDEMKRVFRIDRVFLYGHSQGGFFVVYFAGEYPDAIDGVVAHASGAWNWSKTGKPVQRVAIAFMHGTADPVVPYRQSVASRDHYAKLGFPRLHLRRLERYNHWPNAVRTDECLTWCEGMTTEDPAVALECARHLIEPKGKDEYQWQTNVDIAGAYAVLTRITGSGPLRLRHARKFKSLAKRQLERLDRFGAEQVKAIAKNLGRIKRLELNGGAWLGHLVSVREDFRGVPSVEKLVKKLHYDDLAKLHATAAGKIIEKYYGGTPAQTYRVAIEQLPNGFLFEGFPHDLATKLEEWKQSADANGLTTADLASYRIVEAWAKSWRDGLVQYKASWSKWR